MLQQHSLAPMSLFLSKTSRDISTLLTTGYYCYYRLQQTSVGPCFLQKLTIFDAAGAKDTPFLSCMCFYIYFISSRRAPRLLTLQVFNLHRSKCQAHCANQTYILDCFLDFF